jgi:hypothetical protein
MSAQKAWGFAHVILFVAVLVVVLGYGQFSKLTDNSRLSAEEIILANQAKKKLAREKANKLAMTKQCEDDKKRSQYFKEKADKVHNGSLDYSAFGHEADAVKRQQDETYSKLVEEYNILQSRSCG